MSDSSSVSSPRSHGESPHSSPSQQVPHLSTYLTHLTCSDNGSYPCLQITQQPQNYFRFRYVSEMIGTHGCLLGKNNGKETIPGKTKTYPTVVLKNYTGHAIVRCRLVQHLNEEEHPHRLLEDDEDRDVSHQVPDDGHYEVAFAGMGIIHTGKKEVPKVLLNKCRERLGNVSYDTAELKKTCEDMAKMIDLNIVRLKFSAHEILTDREICKPVYSQPIKNLKSAATNDLKICRMSRNSSKPEGNVENIILVEKVNKKNIKIRFFEMKGDKEVWTTNAYFLQAEVHHQFAIVFRVPPYRDKDITSEVKVWVELVRPSDGNRSEPLRFTYKPDIISKQSKKRKANSSYSSFESNSSISDCSIKNAFPTPVLELHNGIKHDLDDITAEPSYLFLQNIPIPQPLASPDDLTGDALLANVAMIPNVNKINMSNVVPQYKKLPEPTLQQISINSTELNNLLDDHMLSEDRRLFQQTDLSDYYKDVFGSFPMTDDIQERPGNSMDFIRSALVSDSGKATGVKKKGDAENTVKKEFRKPEDVKREQIEYTAFYSAEDGAEVKQLVKELTEAIRNKTQFKKQVVRAKLERLFEMRLSNGDTFLHMTLCCNLQSLNYIVKIVHGMEMSHLLNLENALGQTVLHLAVLNDLPSVVDTLISNGCNPTKEDIEGNTPIHYAVRYQACMRPLLESIKTNKVSCDLNSLNKDNKSPLHLTAIYNSAAEALLLLQNGASYDVSDTDGRTPLHLVAFEDCLSVAKTLLKFIKPEDIDVTDSYGNTALQIVCGGDMRENTEEIVKLLLEKKADPMLHEERTEPAWKLVRDMPNIRDIMMTYMALEANEDECKSEAEDDYESLDEGDGTESCLSDLSQYIDELSLILDNNGSWKTLALRLHHGSLLNWYENTKSPTRTLLGHIRECGENVSSKSLVLVLDDIGQNEAADVVRKHT